MLAFLSRALCALSFTLALFLPSVALAEAGADRSLSPYFFVEGAAADVDALPLATTNVEIAVNGPIADVTVTQVYQNAGKRPLNAEYVFPASTRAAVHGLRVTIRDQVIEARIEERRRAERSFEAAKRAGKTASLLEQQRPNVFTMKVANVLPGDRIEVTLRYTELLVPNAGSYELVYPTVVGPRYSNQSASTAAKREQWTRTPYLHAGTPASSTFELKGTISSPISIQKLSSETHPVRVVWANTRLAHFSVAPGSDAGNNRDFVLRYQLAGLAIQSGLSLYEGGGEKFFLLMVEPPARVVSEAMPPREYVFIVDVSGSMSGFPLDTTKELLKKLTRGLRPIDRFNLLTFSGGSELLAPASLPATPANLTNALAILDEQQGGGATELLPALERAMTLSAAPGFARSFVVITDGFVSADRETLSYVRTHLGKANTFAFGIGSSVNRFLIEGIARAGAGEPFIVTDPAFAAREAERLYEYVRAPVLTDVRVNFGGLDVYDVEPRAIPDVFAARPVVIHGKWRGAPKGRVELHGTSGSSVYTQTFELEREAPRGENRALRQLWARTRIASLADFPLGQAPADVQAQVTALGLRYNLLTEFTSFVAVTNTIRNTRAPASDVKQPLPLPLGVTDGAIGQSVESASEPELLLLLALVAAFIAAHRMRRCRLPEAAS